MTRRCTVLPALLVSLLGAGALGGTVAQDATNVLRFEQPLRAVAGGRVALRTYATIIIPPNALKADTTLVAELDLDTNTLTLNTDDGQKLAGRIAVEVNFDRFPNGLTVLLQTPKAAPPIIVSGKLRLIGTLTNVDFATRTLSVDTPDEFREVKVPNGVTIKRQENDAEAKTIALDGLGLGDQVTLTLAPDGRTPRLIEARYFTTAGIIRSVAARRVVLSPNAEYAVSQGALVTSERGDELEMADLRAGQRVTMRLNPMTREVWEITLGNLRGNSLIQSLTHDAAQAELKPGDVVTVTLIASTGGRGTVEVEGLPTLTVALREALSPRGTYTAKLTIPNVALPARAQVMATFDSADNKRETRTAAEPLRFAARLAADRIPAPTIASPREGEVGGSVVVKGRTAPNAKVLVKIAFIRKALVSGLGGSKGTLPDVELKADAKGDFETMPIALRGPRLLEDSVEYTFSVTAQRTDGKHSEEAVVRVVRK